MGILIFPAVTMMTRLQLSVSCLLLWTCGSHNSPFSQILYTDCFAFEKNISSSPVESCPDWLTVCEACDDWGQLRHIFTGSGLGLGAAAAHC